MKRFLSLILLLAALSSTGQEVEVVSFSELQEKMISSGPTLKVFNFWATWCKPCIKELPYFQALDESHKNVKVYLVSVDFQSELERVKAFVAKRSLTAQVLFLNEKDPDDYMPKISKEWSGAIPATLFVTDMGKTYFHEKAFEKEELFQRAKNYLK